MTPLHEAAETAYALGQTELAAAIRAGERELRAEVEAAKVDAERYRWLRSDSGAKLEVIFHASEPPYPLEIIPGDEFDAAIDAEMAKDATHAAYMAASNALGQEL